MKKIAVLTATRAEFGLLKPVILKMQQDGSFDVHVLVTGMHLCNEFGNTYQEIEAAGIRIEKKISIQLSGDEPADISKTMGLALIGFADLFAERKYDALLVLGDRYETLAVCAAAMNARIPIFHMHGGELTEGLIDEAIRHSITKMSYLHFTSTETYRKRVIQLGESPDRVFNVGATGVENALSLNLLSKQELEQDLDVSFGDKLAVVTFHPVTLESVSAAKQVEELIAVMSAHDDIFWLITKANSDTNGRIINEKMEHFAESHTNAKCVASLGVLRYLSAVKNAAFIIGNSSSGLVEVPSFHIPTINIGDRQRGRIEADSIISCDSKQNSIEAAIKIALSDMFNEKIKNTVNPYGNGKTSEKIVAHIKDVFTAGEIDIKKKFYDME